MPPTVIESAVSTFSAHYAQSPQAVVRAPGRVNLIGEHTDYNDGFCLPMAIEHSMAVAWSPRADRRVELVNADGTLPGFEFGLDDDLQPHADSPWYNYVVGCVKVLRASGQDLRGCSLAFSGDVPMGSGLSSSAALEVATIHALLAVANIQLAGPEIARLAQRAENDFVGVQCGILDQLASACCQQSQAMLMDCRSLDLQQVPLPESVAVVIADTGKRRGLVDSAYNLRRRQCEAGAAALGAKALRDVTMQGLMEAESQGLIDSETKRRCEHVVAENGRTLAAAAALRAGDAVALGQLMDQSHADLRDKFAVTCPELDAMVAVARSLPGCLGSRMTGAGFGGCTVSLVERQAVEAFVPNLLSGYAQRSEHRGSVYVTTAAAGAGPAVLPGA
ncbi:MAG: galactokinase [Planctomycetota bacterium]|nr:MAG: galactokinase [Planctomycetota bacterium]